MDIKELQKIVISILKHEYQAKALNIKTPELKSPVNKPKPNIATKTAVNRIIRREKKNLAQNNKRRLIKTVYYEVYQVLFSGFRRCDQQ